MSIDRVKPGFTILIGKPNSGKSHLLKYLLTLDHPDYSDDPIRYGLIFTNTKFTGFWEQMFPRDFIHPKFDPTALEALMNIQSQNPQNKCVVVFDDSLSQQGFASQLFLDLTTQYRHFGISIYISTQYIYKVNPTIRECSSYVAAFRLTTERSLKAAYDSFGSYFKNFDEFRKYVIDNTGNYQFIYYEANSSKDDRNEIYKIMRAPKDIPNVKFVY